MLLSHSSLLCAQGGERARCPPAMLDRHRESKPASAKLTYHWRQISQVCCFAFVFSSQFFRPSGKKGCQHPEWSQYNARVWDFHNSVPVLLLFSKMFETKEVERWFCNKLKEWMVQTGCWSDQSLQEKLSLIDVIVRVMLHLAPQIRFNAINGDKAHCSWQYTPRPCPWVKSLQCKAQIGAAEITDWGGQILQVLTQALCLNSVWSKSLHNPAGGAGLQLYSCWLEQNCLGVLFIFEVPGEAGFK